MGGVGCVRRVREHKEPPPPLPQHAHTRQVGVRLKHVRVHVVADDVLVVPRDHGAARVPVEAEAADALPPALAVADGRVARVVHGVHERHGLEDAEHERRDDARGERRAREQLPVGDAKRGERDGKNDAEAPHARPRRLGVLPRRLKVGAHALRHLRVEAALVARVRRELGRAGQHADAQLVERRARLLAVVPPVVHGEERRALAARREQQHLLAARVPLEEGRDVVDGAVYDHPRRVRRVVRRDLLPREAPVARRGSGRRRGVGWGGVGGGGVERRKKKNDDVSAVASACARRTNLCGRHRRHLGRHGRHLWGTRPPRVARGCARGERDAGGCARRASGVLAQVFNFSNTQKRSLTRRCARAAHCRLRNEAQRSRLRRQQRAC